jgi:NADH:ubiquinone oxidoreductase subunit F (NADH-binding)/Pyruvate/2-oxoacid:ferredoxin oxidoreductase delta subunit
VESHLVKGEPVRRYALALMQGKPLDGLARFDDLPAIKPQRRVVLRNCGVIDPLNLDHYVARGGYSGLKKALSLTPEEVIQEIERSGLRGRGGAGFPTARKWSLARQAAGDSKYVVCNADEGDPGAFMNRSVLEGDPHAVLEGMIIAGYAIGAKTGYVYIRAEYPLAVERILHSLRELRVNGLLGDRILGSDFSFDIKMKKGAGAFVCGEETALMASVEGHRGMPRSKPPFPASSGLFQKPTNINNVETLAAVSVIMEKGGAWYAQFGTEKSRGTKTFSLAGKISRTGLIEVPLGTPLRTIIEDIGGGCLEGKQFKAVQTGGPSGGCIPAQLLDTPVDYEHLAEAGSIMGSGGMVVMDEDSCMVDVARYFLSFTENESCGKCVPCRMGTQHLLNLLTDITEGRGQPEQLEQMQQIGDTMKKASLCGLGQTAPNPVLTTLRYFEDEYRAHIKDHKCPAGTCSHLIIFRIDPALCTGCRICAINCPTAAISGEKKQAHAINQTDCIRCGACVQVCRYGAVTVE